MTPPKAHGYKVTVTPAAAQPHRTHVLLKEVTQVTCSGHGSSSGDAPNPRSCISEGCRRCSNCRECEPWNVTAVTRDIILTTRRLVLTTWDRSDVEALLEIHSDPLTMRFVRTGRPETRAQTTSLIEGYMTEQSGRGWTKWRLADRDGVLVGRAGFGEHQEGRELGYTIGRNGWGQSLATEIAEALVRWHLEWAPGIPLRAYAAVDNAASHRVLEKTGFAKEATTTHNLLPCFLYRLARGPGSASVT